MINKDRLMQEINACIIKNIFLAEEKIVQDLNEMDIYVKKVNLKDINVTLLYDANFYNKIGNRNE